MVSKYRVLHVIPTLGSGGAERLTADLVKFLNKERFEGAVCSFFPRNGSIIEKELDQANIPVFYLRKQNGLDLSLISQLKGVFQRFAPDVIHTHLSVLRYTIVPTVLQRIKGRVHTIHSQPKNDIDLPGKYINKFAFHNCGVIPVSISGNIQKQLNQFYGVHNSPVIFNGADIERFKRNMNDRDSLRRELGINQKTVLLHIGSFTEAKNHFNLIQSFSQIKKNNSEVVLLLVGEGKLRPTIESLVSDHNLRDSVYFLGLRQDVAKILAAADIFVLSSDWEGVPIVIIEAMAAGLSIVATNVGGVPELVNNGKNGFLVPPSQPEMLANSILNLIKDPELQNKFGKQSEILACQYDIRETICKYENLYLKNIR